MAYKHAKQRRLKNALAAQARPLLTLNIKSIDLEGNGIAHHDGKVVFVNGAMTGECVTAQITKTKSNYEKANVVAVLKPSPQRVSPQCPHFGVCGGCSLQHIDAQTQVAIKQRALEDQLLHIGKIKGYTVLPPVFGFAWGYRYRARLSVKYVEKKNTVLIGFHERLSSYIADIQTCAILPPHISNLLMPLRELIATLSVRSQVPQIEVAVGETDTVLLLRHLQPLTLEDTDLMRSFADNNKKEHPLIWYTQSEGSESIKPLNLDNQGNLHYTLPAFKVIMPFKVSDFTQVNPHINRILVSKALALLNPQQGERILDLFCGLGNFTLPLARQVGLTGYVCGIEGSVALTERATHNAQVNDIHHIQFSVANLFDTTTETIYEWGQFDRWLIDPPREGAQAVCEALLNLPKPYRPQRIVYVSCNPSTLARDASILCGSGHWHLSQAGIANMFPHTNHVESIAVFERI